jgi:hypothetical protein
MRRIRYAIKKTFKFLKKLFTEHPNNLGESYIVHFFWALVFSIHLLVAGVACLVHAVFPFLFKDTASSIAEWVTQVSKDRRELW